MQKVPGVHPHPPSDLLQRESWVAVSEGGEDKVRHQHTEQQDSDEDIEHREEEVGEGRPPVGQRDVCNKRVS